MKLKSFCSDCGTRLRPALNLKREVEVVCECGSNVNWNHKFLTAALNITYTEFTEYKDHLIGRNVSTTRYAILYHPTDLPEPIFRMVNGYTALEYMSVINMIDIAEDMTQVLFEAKYKAGREELQCGISAKE